MKSNRHLSEITETEQTRFPPTREYESIRTETYIHEAIRTETYIPSFLRTYIPSFPQGQKTKIRNLQHVIPTKDGIQFLEFQSFPINCLSIEFFPINS
ncbi:Uncharacterised protein [Neisseria meningitidis]|nr:Uncharacterised protein [Neisseria meningitidis]